MTHTTTPLATGRERPILFNADMVLAILDGQKTQTRRPVLDMPPPPAAPGAYFDDYDGGPYWNWWLQDHRCHLPQITCPFGRPGDRLWVREKWRVGAWDDATGSIAVDYAADNHCRREWLSVPGMLPYDRLRRQSVDDAIAARLTPGRDSRYRWNPGSSPCRWRPSIHMPRWASRLTLQVTDVRVEQLHAITPSDIMAEGARSGWEPEAFDGDRLAETLATEMIYTEWAHLWDTHYGQRPGQAWDDNPWVWVVAFERVATVENHG